MPRVARVVALDVPHHITQRGNNRQDIFFVDDDRRVYLELLARQSAIWKLAILGYCLMGNHVHIIAIPRWPDSLAKALGRTHWLYSLYVNRLHGRSGHLWQNRFYSAPMDDRHCLDAMRYVECNPLRARICRDPIRYGWSSAAAHCTGRDALGLLDLRTWKTLNGGTDWRDVLREPLSARQIALIRRATHTGRPLASDRFIAR
jgi:putative transposase